MGEHTPSSVKGETVTMGTINKTNLKFSALTILCKEPAQAWNHVGARSL